MSITDLIESLFENGVVMVQIGRPEPGAVPPDSAKFLYVQARQFVNTGPPGNNIQIIHQTLCPSLVASLNQIKDSVATGNEMRGRGIQIVSRDGKN